MAIAPTGAIYKALTFDGTSSRTYGVYITGKAVYNAPARNVDMISIPGRNGSFALDQGRFENIEVTYPAGIFADTETDFADAISDFRNFLCSKEGYVRLTDEYNPNEYRMAVYKSGLEVSPALLKAGEFDITFECMPQRWLTSGETSVSVSDGDTITNPTLFDSHPLLEVTGYGNIGINSETVTVTNAVVGEIFLMQGSSATGATTTQYTVPLTKLNSGDSVYSKSNVTIERNVVLLAGTDLSIRITGYSNVSASVSQVSYRSVKVVARPTNLTFQKGTSKTVTSTIDLEFTVNKTTTSGTYTVTTAWNGSTGRITVTETRTNFPNSVSVQNRTTYITNIYGYSTVSAIPATLYVDLDIGEAYGEMFGETTLLNNAVEIPSKLPTLNAGSNTITYDNTVTDLKIVPRWWKV